MNVLTGLPQHIDFKLPKEEWDIYELDDGTILRIRAVLIDVVTTGQVDSIGNPNVLFSTHNVLGVKCPEKLRGPPNPSPVSPQEISSSVEAVVNIRRTIKDDSWTEYELENGFVLGLRLVVTDVRRTSKFDRNGDPIYSVNSQLVTRLRRRDLVEPAQLN